MPNFSPLLQAQIDATGLPVKELIEYNLTAAIPAMLDALNEFDPFAARRALKALGSSLADMEKALLLDLDRIEATKEKIVASPDAFRAIQEHRDLLQPCACADCAQMRAEIKALAERNRKQAEEKAARILAALVGVPQQ